MVARLMMASAQGRYRAQGQADRDPDFAAALSNQRTSSVKASAGARFPDCVVLLPKLGRMAEGAGGVMAFIDQNARPPERL